MPEMPTSRSMFTLKDVEGSVTTFAGTGSPDVDHWIQELEECALTVEWNQLQLFIYSKQLLSGAAKSFIRSQVNIRNWDSLKAALRREFAVKISSAEVHRKLGQRVLAKGETLQEYLYALMEIAKPVNLDEESLIDYFVKGVPDATANKIMLYQNKTIRDLKEQIEVYKKVRGTYKGSFRNEQRTAETEGSKGFVSKPEFMRKCFKCGDPSHLKKDCKKKDNFNCYRCGQPGHRAAQCKTEHEVKKESNTNAIHLESAATKPKSELTASGLELKVVKHPVVQFKGLADTGADLCLMRRNIFLKIGSKLLTGREKCLTGIGESQVLMFGSIILPVEIDNIEMEVQFRVVPEEDMGFDAILGRTILDIVDMKVTKEGTKFLRRNVSRSIDEEQSNIDTDFLQEFRGMCAEQVAVSGQVDLSHLDQSQVVEVKNLIEEYVAERNVDAPVQMKIILKDEIPVYQHPWRFPVCDQKTVNDQVKEWLSEKIIQPSTSEYASPVVLVSKKNGKKRLCCDYRKLNEKIIRDNFPMAHMETVLDKLQGSKIFTTLDLTNGFFHVPIEPVSGSGFKNLVNFFIKIGATYGENVDVDDLIPHERTLSRNAEKLAMEKRKIVAEDVKDLMKSGGVAATLDM
nr:uncharacterized protein LOC121502695 [Drosophila kikkawai]